MATRAVERAIWFVEMARRPRYWLPNQPYFLTLRTVDRQFLLKPSPETRNITGACIARALKKYPVQLLFFDSNINHIHAAFYLLPDQVDNASQFCQLLDGLLARELNRHWDRTGPFWSSRARIEPIVDDDALVEKLLYSACNTVKDDLVEHPSHWRGYSTYRALAQGEVERFWYVDRTAWWRKGGPVSGQSVEEFVRWIEVKLSRLPAWEGLSEAQRQSRFRHLVRGVVEQKKKERSAEGRSAMGVRSLDAVDHRERPASAKRSSVQPLCHASSKAGRMAYRDLWRAFIDLYREASARFRSGDLSVQFPSGSFRPRLVAIHASAFP